MKYLKQELTVSTICNEEIDNEETILSLFDALKKHNIHFKLSLLSPKDPFDKQSIIYDDVVVLNVDRDKKTIDIRYFGKKALAKIRNITFDRILSIEVISAKNEFLLNVPNIGKFDLLDIDND